jgi:hypothetical protein
MLAGTIEIPLKKLNVSTIFLGKHVNDIPESFYSGELDNVRVYNTVIEPSLIPLIRR